MPPETVLLAVDDALIRWALEKELSARGVQVDGVETGQAALDRVRKSGYGLAFLDIHLPGAGGLALLDVLRECAPQTKIVVLGCDEAPEVKRAVYERGAWQFVEKPFDLRDVVGLVRSVFGSYSDQRRHPRYLCRLPLRVSLLTDAPEPRVELDNLSCATANIGPGGLRLLTGYRLSVGQRLRVRVLRRGEPCATHIPPGGEAQVVWIGTTESGSTAGLHWLTDPTPDRIS